MLSINKTKDKEKMMKYHRTRDMLNLLFYFPQASPIKDLVIIENYQDYLDNYDFCKDLYAHRIDSLINKPVINSIQTTGDRQDIKKLIEQIKKIDKEGVLLLFDLIHDYSERYERFAGISIGVSVGNGVYIEAVGKGFDGREVSKGISTHERYYIAWEDLRTCRLENFKTFQIYEINDIDYQKSRNERINFLSSIGLIKDKVASSIPEHYEQIPNFIWEDVIKNIISKLYKMEDELLISGYNEFAISGHTEGKRFLPWQMFDKKRYNI